MDKVSMSQIVSFSRYQIKCVIKFSFGQMMTSKTLRFLLIQPLKQWLTGKKRSKAENTKIWISWERNSVFKL